MRLTAWIKKPKELCKAKDPGRLAWKRDLRVTKAVLYRQWNLSMLRKMMPSGVRQCKSRCLTTSTRMAPASITKLLWLARALASAPSIMTQVWWWETRTAPPLSLCFTSRSSTTSSLILMKRLPRMVEEIIESAWSISEISYPLVASYLIQNRKIMK